MIDEKNVLEGDGDFDASGFESSIELDLEEVPATDITFECPHCGKSLSIDPRGAGIVITCTQCEKPVTVPIPEGMELEDFDITPEELAISLSKTRQHLTHALSKIEELEEEVRELRSYKQMAERIFEKRRALDRHMSIQFSQACKLQDDTVNIIKSLASLIIPEEERKA